MITSIDYLKNFGCYDNFKFRDGDIKPFNQVNILFGSNGSGKTTLSNLFFLLSKHCKNKQNLISDYLDDDTLISIQIGNEKATEKNIHNQNRDIYVFNSKFITDHVYNGTTSNIDAFSSEIKLTNESIKLIDDRLTILKTREIKVKAWKANLDQKLDEIWTNYKDTFQEIVSDARLTGKKPLTTETDSGEVSKEDIALNSLYIEYRKKNQESTTNEKLSSLKTDIEGIRSLEADFNELNELLSFSISYSVKNKVKDRIGAFQEIIGSTKLANSVGDLNSWFKLGAHLLHLGNDVNKHCPLCDTNLTDAIERILDEYKDYFNDTLNNLLKRLDDNLQRIGIFKESHFENNILKLNAIQSDLKSLNIDQSLPNLESNEVLQKDLESVADVITQKKNNVNNILSIDQNIIDRLVTYSRKIDAIKEELFKKIEIETTGLGKRSKRTITDEIKEKINKIVKLQFNSETKNIFSSKNNNSTAAIACNRLHDKLTKQISKLNIERTDEISKLDAESKFVNYYLDHLGILHFTINRNKNKTHDNITITYNTTGKQKLNLRASLSEGEKTALAFAYFISKIRVEKLINNIHGLSDCIVVIDDPISSLDDNRLFQTANAIDSFFFYHGSPVNESPKQIFIFSHNQTFTKYMSGALRSNEKLKGLIHEYYLHPKEPRIRKIPSALKNFTNTYLIKLREIIEYKEKRIPDYDTVKNYLPNYIRIVLETFLSFKLALVNDDSNRVPGLSTLISKMVSELMKTHDYEMEIDGGNKLDRDDIIKRLTHLKKIADHESHGNIAKGQEVSFIAEDELRNFAKYTIQVILYIDSIHISRTKGHN